MISLYTELITSKIELTICICCEQPELRSSFSSLQQSAFMLIKRKEQKQKYCSTISVFYNQTMHCKDLSLFFGVVGEGGRMAFYLTYYLVSFLFSLQEPLSCNMNASSEGHQSITSAHGSEPWHSTSLPLPTAAQDTACVL